MRVIDQMLKEVAEGTDGINSFGHGPKSFANVEESKFPRIWVYDTFPTDSVYKNGHMDTKYQVIMEISTLIQFDETIENVFEKGLAVVDPIWKKFITRLNRDSRNMVPIGEVRRVELLHGMDENVAGYICTFTVKPTDNVIQQCL